MLCAGVRSTLHGVVFDIFVQALPCTALRSRRARRRPLPPVHRMRRGAVAMDQIGDIEPGNGAIAYHPVAADHHPIGAVGAAQDQRRQRIAVAGEA